MSPWELQMESNLPQKNPWIWSPEHNNHYRVARKPDGSWEQIWNTNTSASSGSAGAASSASYPTPDGNYQLSRPSHGGQHSNIAGSQITPRHTPTANPPNVAPAVHRQPPTLNSAQHASQTQRQRPGSYVVVNSASGATHSIPPTGPGVQYQSSGGSVVTTIPYRPTQSNPQTGPRTQYQSSGAPVVVDSPYAMTQSNPQTRPPVPRQDSGGQGALISPHGGTQSSSRTVTQAQYQSFGGPVVVSSQHAGTQSNPQTRLPVPRRYSGGHGALISPGTQSSSQTRPQAQYQSSGGHVVVNSPYAVTQSNPQTRPQAPRQGSGGHGALNSQSGEIQPSSQTRPQAQRQSSGGHGAVNSPYGGTQPNPQTELQTPRQSYSGHSPVNSPHGTQSIPQTDGPSQHGDEDRTALKEIRRYDTMLRHDNNHQEWPFFVPGRVFKVRVFAEGVSVANSASLVQYEGHFEKTYRFIVVFPHTKEHWSYCLLITTYGGHACTKKDLQQKKHTMVYTTEQPSPKLPGEENMNKDPIRMNPIDNTEKLDPKSRVNLAKLHVIEHNVSIKDVGMIVPQRDIRKLQGYCKEFR